jgi:hypothetical protein
VVDAAKQALLSNFLPQLAPSRFDRSQFNFIFPFTVKYATLELSSTVKENRFCLSNQSSAFANREPGDELKSLEEVVYL